MTDAGCAVKNNKELPQTAGEYTLDSLVMYMSQDEFEQDHA